MAAGDEDEAPISVDETIAEAVEEGEAVSVGREEKDEDRVAAVEIGDRVSRVSNA